VQGELGFDAWQDDAADRFLEQRLNELPDDGRKESGHERDREHLWIVERESAWPQGMGHLQKNPGADDGEHDSNRNPDVRVRAQILEHVAPEQHLYAEEVRAEKRVVDGGAIAID